MKKNARIRIGRYLIQITMMLLIGSGLVFTTACSKKKIRSDYPSLGQAGGQNGTGAGMGGNNRGGIGQETLGGGSGVSENGLAGGASGAGGAGQMGATQTAREKFESDDVYFEYDSAALMPEAQSVLMEKSEWLQNNPQVNVVIEGHTDERGTVAYNLALGDRRAESVRAFLMELGVDTGRMRTVSYGEERPLDPGQGESAWAKNRRAHFSVEE